MRLDTRQIHSNRARAKKGHIKTYNPKNIRERIDSGTQTRALPMKNLVRYALGKKIHLCFVDVKETLIYLNVAQLG